MKKINEFINNDDLKETFDISLSQFDRTEIKLYIEYFRDI
jgi:hypothetical protein